MKSAVRIMVVDDEKIVRESLSVWLKKFGYEVVPVEGGKEALDLLDREEWSILLVDLKMPRIDGIEVLHKVLKAKPDIPVIIFTAYATVETAVEAMRVGAYDYLIKPIDPDMLALKLQKIVEKQNLADENIMLREKIDAIYEFDEIIGNSKPIQKVLEMVGSVAASDATVLVTGESGTGKELIAQAIHRNSERRYKPFIGVSIGALPDTMVESELFGHDKGAFTGADHARMGRFELTDGGTLFLDEVGDMSPKVQVDLLRVLEEKACYRLGGNRKIHTDVRVIAATNKNLKKNIEEGTFREDLYFRLNVVGIHLPPLRERGDDVLLLAEYFLKKFCMKMNKKKEGFSPKVIEIFSRYKWPGNIRELKNAIERAIVVGKEPLVQLRDMPFGGGQEFLPEEKAEMSLREAEKKHILRVLDMTGWNVTRSARLLKIDRATLYNKIKNYNLSKPKRRH
ncbi:MAG: sigma-54-dependent Fis family transcriptional regulator [candidate division Zixibacteria bacterium]|nr:sigma-54-dependent Fis family transcriptional regulator [candidate division Zixibacteria bacterium]